MLLFTKKEMDEQIRTFKGLVILAVLLIFGMTSPLMAKLTPEIINLAGTGSFKIEIPAPTFVDAYAQFFKNISEMALLVLILLFCGSVSGEVSKGTARIMLTKRLSRTGFVLSKFICGAVVWTVGYWAAAGLCVCYTVYLFPGGRPAALLLAFFCMWLFGCLTLAATILASAVFNGYALSAVGAFCLWGAVNLLGIIKRAEEYLPSSLGNLNSGLIGGSVKPASMLWSVVTGIALTAVFLAAACLIFRKKEL